MDNFGTFVFILIWSSIWGLATRKVIILKGYKENWFWLGFFFTFIAFIFALLRPLPPNDYVRSTHARSGTSDEPGDPSEENVTFASWPCPCGRHNASYTATCACGRTREVATEQLKQRTLGTAMKSEQSKTDGSKGKTTREEQIESRKDLVRELDGVRNTRARTEGEPVGVSKVEKPTPVWMKSNMDVEPEPYKPAQAFMPPPPTHEPLHFAPEFAPKTVPAKPEPVAPNKPEPVAPAKPDPKPEPKPVITKAEIITLLNQAQQLESAREIYSLLNENRARVRTQEFDSLLQDLRNCSDVERVYGNSKSTAILHINLYRNTIAFQTESPSFA